MKKKELNKEFYNFHLFNNFKDKHIFSCHRSLKNLNSYKTPFHPKKIHVFLYIGRIHFFDKMKIILLTINSNNTQFDITISVMRSSIVSFSFAISYVTCAFSILLADLLKTRHPTTKYP